MIQGHDAEYGELGDVDRAVAAADAIFLDPDSEPLFEPNSVESARAAVDRLGQLFAELPGTVKRALDGARVGGQMLSSDRLQGLSEIVQNADDVGATRVSFQLGGRDLLAAHDGRPIRLLDVLALATPWLTTKGADPNSVGRFGIGLVTLRVLSPILEVFSWPYAIRIDGSALSSVDPIGLDEDFLSNHATTTLRLSLDDGVVLGLQNLEDWLSKWDESALVFCRSVSEVSVGNAGAPGRALGLRWDECAPMDVEIAGERVSAARAVACAADGRRWTRWSVEVTSPAGLGRQHKDVGTTMPIGVAVPLHEERSGRIYAGLPLTEARSKLLVNAHFDPVAGRHGLLDNAWNSALIGLVADLWVHLLLDLFRSDPKAAWRLVPMPEEEPGGSAVNRLDETIVERARSVLSNRILFESPSGPLGLHRLGVEVDLLEGVLRDDQIARLAHSDAALPLEARDAAGEWRRVLADWRASGALLPEPISVRQALPLLAEDLEVSQTIYLAAAALSDGLDADLLGLAWVADENGDRFPPPSPEGIWAFTTSNDRWALDLELARKLHNDFQAPHDAAERIVQWLVERGSLIDRIDPGAFLERLSAAGNAGHKMTASLSDDQMHSVRDAVEALPTATQHELGSGIGRAIRIEAFEFIGGKRSAVVASPSEVYLSKSIDREPDSFAVAADTTAGLVWADSRYATLLRSPLGRAGLGAQRFLRILGAEIAPRLVAHPDLVRRYNSDARLGLPKYVPDGPRPRSDFLTTVGADFTLEDFDSPDLELVLRGIANDKRARRRRSRAAAMLATLGRAWDRIGDRAEVTAAATDYGWQKRASTPAFWIWQARTIEWLDNAVATPTEPSGLWIRTLATMAVHGADAPDYLHTSLPTDRKEILNVLGVTGEPTMADMVDRLAELRDEGSANAGPVAADAALLYRGIADQVGSRGQTPGHLTASRLRARFSSGSGLIRTDQGWRKPNDILAGPPVFGHFRAFTPQVPGAEALWGALEVPRPSWRDCVDVLRRLQQADDGADPTFETIELDTWRLLARLIEEDPLSGRSVSVIGKLGLRTSQGRRASRPIFALPDPMIVRAIGGELPVWLPGGELDQFLPLIEPLGVTLLGPDQTRIEGAVDAIRDEEASALFHAAVVQLQEDLVRNEPDAAASLIVDWGHLEGFDVLLADQLTAHVTPPKGLGQTVVGPVDAYADPENASLYLTDASQLDSYDGAARAIASLFTSDARRLAQAWLAACATARTGREARRLNVAAIRSEEEKRRNEAAMEQQLRALQQETSAKPNAPAQIKKANATGSEKRRPAEQTPPRDLVDPGALVVLNPDGQIIGGEATANSRREAIARRTDPDLPTATRGGSPIRGHVAPRGYTDLEKETVGLDLARRVLRSDAEDLVDLRGQRGVGADAIDELDRYFELKVYEGPEPDRIRLEPSQIRRAAATPDFFLVVVSNVEGVQGNPKVRIITDPLSQLETTETRAISFSGVRSARSLVYELALVEDDVRLT